MSSSQALETAIGLVLMFFVISTAASGIVEIISQVFKVRARYLEKTIGNMLAGTTTSDSVIADAIGTFKGTSIYEAAELGSRRGMPSYLSAKGFAEGVAEMLDDGHGALRSLEDLPPGLRRRLESLARQPMADANAKLLHIKSGLEQWFDETMGRLQGAYKRWAAWILLAFGLLIAVSANTSAYHVAERLWKEPATRAAVSNAATGVIAEGGEKDLASVAEATEKLDELRIPIGWDEAAKENFKEMDWTTAAMVAGWLTTAVLVSLGAPFWFDLLTRLVSLRNAGSKPLPASKDPASATSQQPAAATAAAMGPAGGTTDPTARGVGVVTTEVNTELARAFGLSPSAPTTGG